MTDWHTPLRAALSEDDDDRLSLTLMLLTGVAGGRRMPLRVAAPADPVSGTADGGGERRQVQFSTPGGTRIIWTIDPDFTLHEVRP
jgi:hypothetical protein